MKLPIYENVLYMNLFFFKISSIWNVLFRISLSKKFPLLMSIYFNFHFSSVTEDKILTLKIQKIQLSR